MPHTYGKPPSHGPRIDDGPTILRLAHVAARGAFTAGPAPQNVSAIGLSRDRANAVFENLFCLTGYANHWAGQRE